MVNVAGRSKGCSTCRQRRLKCDETTPECSQCVKKGFRCSGPRTGAVFIHALPHRPSALRSTESRPRDAARRSAIQPASRVRDEHPSRPSLLSNYQPSRVEIFDQLFVSHFIDSFAFVKPNPGKQSSTWLDELAELIVSPTHNVAKYSIRSSSMFFYGFMTQNVAMQTEASRWYLKALQGLQNHLLKEKPSSFSGDMICAAVMLTHFESLAGTAPGAWFQHVRGASMMIATGGPESCRQGFLHDAISALFRNEQHPFSTDEWMSVPFELLPKGPFDELVDIFFSLLPCLALADGVTNSSGNDFHNYKTQLNNMVYRMITRLHIWWSQCFARTDLSQPNPEANIPTSNEPIYLPDSPHDVPLLPHRDMPTTALAALFYAANVIVYRLLFLVSSSAHQYEHRIQKHVQATLSTLEFVSTTPKPVSERGFIMVALPLRIVQIWAPCAEGDNAVGASLDRWAQDMPSSAAPTEFFAHVASHIHNNYLK
ncbi:hypothetical protein N7478_011034 [Penicillium angulare]|uniref:uncharacterized protein n=1 Tax=Penicillium angulare TaxID=116970 RepID=UPI00254249CC|nr:uncharacterized protein N7478_011034 [Penicillium angulare]KAJ5263429.1 hypothetical protein N7478_011034 [Penicillium angulare]